VAPQIAWQGWVGKETEIVEMAVPFGFSVGDFIAVGKLIAQIVDELREVCSRVHVALS
jgi:hypothetical protein